MAAYATHAGGIAVVGASTPSRAFVCETLRGAGYRVHEYDARATFLVDVASTRPGVVLLGADDDGFDVGASLVVRTLQGSPLAVRTPVILYSADAYAHERAAAHGMDGTTTLPAPFSAEQLLHIVRVVGERTPETNTPGYPPLQRRDSSPRTADR